MPAEEAIRALQQLEFQESLLRSCALGSVPPEQLESDFNARSFPTPSVPPSQAVLHTTAASASHPGAIYRLAGDRCQAPSRAFGFFPNLGFFKIKASCVSF